MDTEIEGILNLTFFFFLFVCLFVVFCNYCLAQDNDTDTHNEILSSFKILICSPFHLESTSQKSLSDVLKTDEIPSCLKDLKIKLP